MASCVGIRHTLCLALPRQLEPGAVRLPAHVRNAHAVVVVASTPGRRHENGSVPRFQWLRDVADAGLPVILYSRSFVQLADPHPAWILLQLANASHKVLECEAYLAHGMCSATRMHYANADSVYCVACG